MITGGYKYGILDFTEILNTEDGSVVMVSPMNSIRTDHGIGIVTINGEDRLAIFGGTTDGFDNLDSVELYNNQTEKWETTSIKWKKAKSSFNYLSVKAADLISHL